MRTYGRADLTEATHIRAILHKTNLAGRNLTVARAGLGTVWPEGFDLKAAGVIYKDAEAIYKDLHG